MRSLCDWSSDGCFFRSRVGGIGDGHHGRRGEVAALHLAAKLESLELVVDLAPADGGMLAAPPVARHDAIAGEPLARDTFGERLLVGLRAECAERVHERPAATPRRGLLTVGALPLGDAARVDASLDDRAALRRREARGEPARRIGLVRALDREARAPAQYVAQRLHGIVRHEPAGDELAQRVARALG